jgi:hypothetical protein
MLQRIKQSASVVAAAIVGINSSFKKETQMLPQKGLITPR